MPVALLLAAGVYLLFFSCSRTLFLAALLPENLATQNTEASSAICSKESFSRTTQRCQNQGGIVYKGHYTLHKHAIQLLIFRSIRVYQYKQWFLLQISYCPQREAEQLWSPEENSRKINLFLCIVVHPWERRDTPACVHRPQTTLGDLSAAAYSSFHALNIKHCTRTCICIAYGISYRYAT